MILTLDPVLSLRRKVPNWTHLVAISTGMFNTLLSAHVNFSSSGRVGLVPGCMWWAGSVEVTGSYYKTCLLRVSNVTKACTIAFNYKYTVTLTLRLRERVLYDSSLLCSLLGYSYRESSRKENESFSCECSEG